MSSQCNSRAAGYWLHAGHGLQWLWPFLIGYRPRKMAILDEVCVVHPQDHLQYLLKLDLQSRMHLQTLAQKQKPTPSKFRLRMRLSQPTTSQKRLKSDIPVQALTGAPGRNFLHTDAPSAESAQKEAGLLLKQYSYRAELYGVKDRSGEVLEAVFQPWYQTLLDMGSIQVRLHVCLLCTCRTATHRSYSWCSQAGPAYAAH